MRTLLLASILALGACGGGDDGGKTTPDAPAAQDSVVSATCAGGEMTVMTKGTGTTSDPYGYDPTSVTIAVGASVQFVMPGIHNVVPDATGSDPGLSVPFSTTACLKFTKAGTFGFHCGPHQFKGTVVVQ